MKRLKKVTEKLVIKFVDQGLTSEQATDAVLELLQEYRTDLESKKFNHIASALEFTFLK